MLDKPVNAGKSDIALAETPQAISVVTSDMLRLRGVTRLADALLTVAGVSRSSTYGFYDAYTLRGFDAAYGSTYLDGLLNEAGGGGSNNELNGLASIEVVKGPAASLFGGGSLGGIVNLVSKRPQKDAFLDATVSTGSYDLVEGTVDANLPLDADGHVAARLNLVYRDSDSFVRFAGQNRIYVAPALTWWMGPQTSLTLLASLKRDHDNPFGPLNAWGSVLPGPDGRKIPISFAVSNGGDEKPIQNENRKSIGYAFDHEFGNGAGFSQTLRYTSRKTFWDRWMFAGNFYNADGDEIDGPGEIMGRYYYGPYDETFRTLLVDTRARVKIATGPLRHNLMGGVDYRNTDSRYAGDGDFDPSHFPIDIFDPDYSIPLSPVSAPYGGHDTGMQRGFYVQDHIEIGDRFTVTLNGRWDRAEFNGEPQTAFSPRAGATYEVIEGATLYASYAKSFTPQFGSLVVLESEGGLPTLIGQAPPERGKNIEFGAKFAFPAARLTGMLSAYSLTRSNVLTSDPAFGPDFSRVTGKQRSKGVEVEAQWQPIEGLSLNAAYTYIDGEILDDETYAAGSPLANIPRHNIALFASYVIPEGPLENLGANAGFQYNSSRHIVDVNLAGEPLVLDLPGYKVFDAGLSYAFRSWSLRLNVNNIFDERYFPDACCITRVTPGQPRNWRLTLGRSF